VTCITQTCARGKNSRDELLPLFPWQHGHAGQETVAPLALLRFAFALSAGARVLPTVIELVHELSIMV
jgi:hypothetical protein